MVASRLATVTVTGLLPLAPAEDHRARCTPDLTGLHDRVRALLALGAEFGRVGEPETLSPMLERIARGCVR